MASTPTRKGRFRKRSTINRSENLRKHQRSKVIFANFQQDDEQTELLDGSRIIDINTLVEHLQCSFCDEALMLQNIVGEQRHGLASEFLIKCIHCAEETKVPTSRYRKSNGNVYGIKKYDVNYRVALGMLDSGMGNSQLNTVLTTLDIPGLTQKQLKKYEEEVGEVITQEAEESCKSARTQEKEHGNTGDSIEIAVSYDMGWQKRGRAHNSLTGVGTIVGDKTKKILDYQIKSKDCRKCKKGNGHAHKCNVNHQGSSKSMEANAAVDMFKRSVTYGLKYTTLIGDDDSTTLHRIRNNINYEVKKQSDIQHTKRSLYGHLLRLKKKHQQCTDMVVAYVRKSFNYALYQNKNKPEELRAALKNIPFHCFGEHSKCGNWCKFNEKGDNYRHNGLPRGRPLTDDHLRADLTELFNGYAANAERLSPMASSQKNETINAIIARKAPKNAHYGGSSSLKYRVAAAVNQCNTGTSYISRTLTKIGIRPGQNTMRHLNAINKKRKSDKLRKESSHFKRKRSTLKKERSTCQNTLEVREGVTYMTGCGETTIHELDDITEIPTIHYKPELDKLSPIVNRDAIIIIDLETTGLGRDADITQIAATNMAGTDTFNQYAIPEKEISFQASRVTKLKVKVDGHGKRRLEYNGAWVDADDIPTLLGQFLTWLENCKQKCEQKLVLVGHNSINFDFPVLYHHLNKNDMTKKIENTVNGIADTLPFSKQKYPELLNHKQSTIAQKLLSNYDDSCAHNALHDVSTLARLIEAADIQTFKTHLYTFSSFFKRQDFISSHKPILNSLIQHLQISTTKYITYTTAQKCADSGLGFEHLKLAFKRNGEDGLVQVLKEKNKYGKPRVTSCKSTLNKIVNFFHLTCGTKKNNELNNDVHCL